MIEFSNQPQISVSQQSNLMCILLGCHTHPASVLVAAAAVLLSFVEIQAAGRRREQCLVPEYQLGPHHPDEGERRAGGAAAGQAENLLGESTLALGIVRDDIGCYGSGGLLTYTG